MTQHSHIPIIKRVAIIEVEAVVFFSLSAFIGSRQMTHNVDGFAFGGEIDSDLPVQNPDPEPKYKFYSNVHL